jgi:hypothetical protein
MKKVYFSKIIETEVNTDLPCVSLYCNSQDEVYDLYQEVNKILQNEGKAKIAKKYFNAIFKVIKNKKLKSTDFPVGFFLNGDTHLLAPLPFQIEKTSVVASSFHIKPLLKWSQRQMAFYVLNIEADSAMIYEGSVTSINLVAKIKFKPDQMGTKINGVLFRFIDEHLTFKNTPLIVAGGNPGVQSFVEQSMYPSLLDEYIRDPDSDIKQFHTQCLELLLPYLKYKEKYVLQKFYDAKVLGTTMTNLKDIASLVAQKKIKHLIVNENLHIWGELNKNDGTFTYSFKQLNSKDDDILDDLCQVVIAYGGQVTVLPKNLMPGQKAACAIIDVNHHSTQFKNTKELVYENSI